PVNISYAIVRATVKKIVRPQNKSPTCKALFPVGQLGGLNSACYPKKPVHNPKHDTMPASEIHEIADKPCCTTLQPGAYSIANALQCLICKQIQEVMCDYRIELNIG